MVGYRYTHSCVYVYMYICIYIHIVYKHVVTHLRYIIASVALSTMTARMRFMTPSATDMTLDMC